MRKTKLNTIGQTAIERAGVKDQKRIFTGDTWVRPTREFTCYATLKSATGYCGTVGSEKPGMQEWVAKTKYIDTGSLIILTYIA